MKKKRLVGWLGLAAGVIAASLLAAGELAAQVNSPGSQAALDTNSLQGGFSATAPDVMPNAGAPIAIDPTPDAPRVHSAARDTREPRGNPLWAIPLKSLTATRERPIFLPSRRPPSPPIVAGPPPAPPPSAPPPAPPPERPRLALVGAVVGDSEAIAIFLDQNSQGIVRLRTGENHQGWTLSAVKGREATLQRGNETMQLALPAPNETQVGMPGLPGPGFPGMRPPGIIPGNPTKPYDPTREL